MSLSGEKNHKQPLPFLEAVNRMTESNGGSFVQAAIPKFDGYYDHWAMLMENFLRSKEYWDLIKKGVSGGATQGAETSTASMAATLQATQLKDLKVKRAQLQALRREFETLYMKEGETVNNFFARTLTIANKMKTHGESMSQTIIIEKVLRSMTAKFDYVVCSIEESNDLHTMTIDELQSSLLVHEQRMNCHRGEEQALKITFEESLSRRGRGVFRGRGRGRGRDRQSFNKSLVECFKCHRLGHYQYECPTGTRRVNFAELDDEEDLLLMMYEEITDEQTLKTETEADEGDELTLMVHEGNASEKTMEIWFLDSGCSNHMSGNREWFSSLDDQFRRTVKLGNNYKMMVMGKGNV